MPGSFASKMVDYFKKNMSSGANITVEGADVKAIKVDLTKSNPLASLERAHSAAHQEVMQEIGIGGAATVKKKSSRFSLSALAGRGSLWRRAPKEVFQGLNEHSIFDSPLQEAISVLGDLSRTLDDDDRRLDALKHVITLLHEPELNAMRDVAGVAETETVKDDAVLQEWLGTRTSSSLARISAMGSAKRFGRLLRRSPPPIRLWRRAMVLQRPLRRALRTQRRHRGSCRVDQAGAAYKRRNDCGCDARARYRPMGRPRV